MVRLVEKSDTAALRALLTRPSSLLDEVVSRVRARQASDLFWEITDITGDTDFRPGARITIEFTIHGTWTQRFAGPKAEQYALAGLHRDMTVEDIRDVIKQEYSSQTRDHTVKLARLLAVFLFDGDAWKIEKLLEPAKTAKTQNPNPQPRGNGPNRG